MNLSLHFGRKSNPCLLFLQKHWKTKFLDTWGGWVVPLNHSQNLAKWSGQSDFVCKFRSAKKCFFFKSQPFKLLARSQIQISLVPLGLFFGRLFVYQISQKLVTPCAFTISWGFHYPHPPPCTKIYKLPQGQNASFKAFIQMWYCRNWRGVTSFKTWNKINGGGEGGRVKNKVGTLSANRNWTISSRTIFFPIQEVLTTFKVQLKGTITPSPLHHFVWKKLKNIWRWVGRKALPKRRTFFQKA